VAETLHGKLSSDFDDTPAQTVPAGAEKIETLVHGGGHAAIKVRTANGDIQLVEANP